MPDHRNKDTQTLNAASVQEDIRVSAREFPRVARAQTCDPDLLGQIEAAALSAERFDCRDVVRRARATGCTAEALVDLYIPEIARNVGDMWCRNSVGFANVTIAVSRLQAMLRELGSEWSGDRSNNASGPSIMLIVPQDVHHTLGAMVLGSQLRRAGLSVRLMLGARFDELAARLRSTSFDAVFISSSCGETLASLCRIVDVVKRSTKTVPPIVIGGTLLDVETKENVTAHTGADYATKIPSEALALCGITTVNLRESQTMSGT